MVMDLDTRQSSYSVEVDSVPHDTWDEIVSGFADAYHEQTACYGSGHWKSRDSHLLLRRNGEAVAGARVAVFDLPVVGYGLAYLRFGPFWRREGRDPDPEVYRAAIDALVQEYCVSRGLCLTIVPRPSPEHQSQEYALLREAGFVRRREMLDPERYLVDVSLSEEAQLKSLHQKWRYNLRQALANELEVRLCEAPHEIDAFNALYRQMVARKNFDTSTPVHMTGDLIAGLPDKLKPKLFMAFRENEPIVGATIGLFGDTAYYMFGASSAAALPLKAGYALHWWIMRWLHTRAVRWYDLGGAAYEPGLRQFKKGMVGRQGHIVVMEGEHDRWTNPLGRIAADALFAIRSARRLVRHGSRYRRQSGVKS